MNGSDLSAPLARSDAESSPAKEHGASPATSPDALKEVQILLACARLQLRERDACRIRNLLEQEPDWDRLTWLAMYHRLASFAYLHLSATAPDLVPERVLEFLRARLIQNAGEALRMTAELLKLVDLFDRNGVLAVPYKGPELAARVYGNVALRSCCDLDIIVKHQDASLARTLLEAVGYRPRHPTSRAGQQFIERNRHSDIFVGEGGLVVELHWAFVDGETSFPVGLQQLEHRLQEYEIGGSKLLVFNPDDLLLILCVHGATHRWDRLEWLCGLVELIRKSDFDWGRVLNRAEENRIEKTLLLGLLLAHDLLDAPIPEAIVTRARADRDVVYLSRIVQDTLARGVTGPPTRQDSLQRDLFRMRLQSTMVDRFRYFFYRLTTPGRREDTRHMVPLGRRSVPLPTFMRPFHVLGKVIGGSLSKLSASFRDRQGRQ